MKRRSEIYRKRILDIFDRLDGDGGEISFFKDAVEAAFTESEWDALAATKPQWKITLTREEGDLL